MHTTLNNHKQRLHYARRTILAWISSSARLARSLEQNCEEQTLHQLRCRRNQKPFLPPIHDIVDSTIFFLPKLETS